MGMCGGYDRLGVTVSERLRKSLTKKCLEHRRVHGWHLAQAWGGGTLGAQTEVGQHATPNKHRVTGPSEA